jgi:SAM-dependent methyltransferase
MGKKKATFDHQKAVGGLWQQLGWLQFGYLVGAGLRPHHYFLDVGCGSMRGGRLFVGYLEKGRYYGFDKERRLLTAGRSILKRIGLMAKEPTLLETSTFDLSSLGGVRFDFALAQSVFSHLIPDDIMLCLKAVVPRLSPCGEFHATWFDSGSRMGDEGNPHPFRNEGNERDIARYPFGMFVEMGQEIGADVQLVGPWGHPRGQKMMVFKRSYLG